MDNEYLAPKDIEKLLGLGHSTVNKLVNLPDFPAIRFGRSIRVRRDELEAYLKENKVFQLW